MNYGALGPEGHGSQELAGLWELFPTSETKRQLQGTCFRLLTSGIDLATSFPEGVVVIEERCLEL